MTTQTERRRKLKHYRGALQRIKQAEQELEFVADGTYLASERFIAQDFERARISITQIIDQLIADEQTQMKIRRGLSQK